MIKWLQLDAPGDLGYAEAYVATRAQLVGEARSRIDRARLADGSRTLPVQTGGAPYVAVSSSGIVGSFNLAYPFGRLHMRPVLARLAIGSLALFVCPQLSGQEPKSAGGSASLMSEGDTTVVFVHHVRPYKRKQYEQWYDSMVVPAIDRIVKKQPETASSFRTRWRLLPTEPSSDGTYAYVFVYPKPSQQAGRGMRGLLLASGLSETDADREFDRFLTFVREGAGYTNVVKARGWTQPKEQRGQ
jgi:hypothetical protein